MGGLFGKKFSFETNLNELLRSKQYFNRFCLTPEQTGYLNWVFSQLTLGTRRMNYKTFKKLYKYVNPNLSAEEVDYFAPFAFESVDSNKDGSISFDEFVDGFVCFQATSDFKRRANSGLFIGCVNAREIMEKEQNKNLQQANQFSQPQNLLNNFFNNSIPPYLVLGQFFIPMTNLIC